MFHLNSPSTALPSLTEDMLIKFVAYCLNTLQIKYSTVKTYLAGIRYTYMVRGISCVFDYSSQGAITRLQTILKGYKKLHSAPSLRRLPITYDILCDIVRMLRRGTFGPSHDLMMETMCTIAFFGFMRCSEFTCIAAFNPAINLCISDLTFDHTMRLAKIFLKASKADPFCKGVYITLCQTDKYVCPYTALLKCMDLRTTDRALPSDPLFINDDGQPFTRYLFLSYLRDVLQRIGIDSNLYNTHSFRIGAESSARQARLEGHLIQTLGRWRSECYLRYIHLSQATLLSAQRAMCVASVLPQ